MNTPKILGIVGGMGPFADELFVSLLNKHIPRTHGDGDGGGIPFVLDCNCTRPDRSAFLTGRSDRSPLPSLLRSLEMLALCGAEIIAMPCNTAHAFWDTLLPRAEALGLTMINMPSETAKVLHSKGIRRAGVLSTEGTAERDIFGKALSGYGISAVYPENAARTETSALIRNVKNGGDGNINRVAAALLQNGADVVVTGCTELSLLLHRHRGDEAYYVDPLSVLVRRSIELCGKTCSFIPYG